MVSEVETGKMVSLGCAFRVQVVISLGPPLTVYIYNKFNKTTVPIIIFNFLIKKVLLGALILYPETGFQNKLKWILLDAWRAWKLVRSVSGKFPSPIPQHDIWTIKCQVHSSLAASWQHYQQLQPHKQILATQLPDAIAIGSYIYASGTTEPEA